MKTSSLFISAVVVVGLCCLNCFLAVPLPPAVDAETATDVEIAADMETAAGAEVAPDAGAGAGVKSSERVEANAPPHSPAFNRDSVASVRRSKRQSSGATSQETFQTLGMMLDVLGKGA